MTRRNGAGAAKLIAAGFALALLLAACGKSSSSANGSPSSSAAGSPSASEASPSASEASPSASSSGGGTIQVGSDTANNHGSKDVSGASSVEVEMDDFYFGPTVITGSPGQSLKIELKNEGSALHNFSIPGQSIDQDVQTGQSSTVTVTIPQSGFVEFFCKYHKSVGMLGELTAS